RLGFGRCERLHQNHVCTCFHYQLDQRLELRDPTRENLLDFSCVACRAMRDRLVLAHGEQLLDDIDERRIPHEGDQLRQRVSTTLTGPAAKQLARYRKPISIREPATAQATQELGHLRRGILSAALEGRGEREDANVAK